MIDVYPVHAVVIILMIKYFVVYISNYNNQLVLVVLMSEQCEADHCKFLLYTPPIENQRQLKGYHV